MDDEGDDNLCFDTDSDLVENKDGTRCQVKWTQEEVSWKKSQDNFLSSYSILIFT